MKTLPFLACAALIVAGHLAFFVLYLLTHE